MATIAVDDRVILAELDTLMRETFTLWDEIWVGFSWRSYTYDHVSRVRNLARSVAQRENGDMRALEFGALLHDITKSYDGEILMVEGKRVVDENGLWRNETLAPRRENRVTRLYHDLNLYGQVHHISGGRIARALLEGYGFDADFNDRVDEIIRAHLQCKDTSSVSGRSLYDADTIDSNIGLPAMYRNFQITAHRQDQDFAKRGESFAAHLRDNLRQFLTPYIRERLPAWNNSKRDDFVSKMTTNAAREIARGRVDRLTVELAALSEELDDYDRQIEHGRLAVVKHLLTNHDNPSLSAELTYLEDEWAPRANPTPAARALLAAFRRESAGTE